MRTIIKILLLSISLLCVSAAYAKPVESSSGVGASSHSEAAQLARQHFGGKVLKVQLERGKNNAGYKVKLLLKDGTVKTVTIAALKKESL